MDGLFAPEHGLDAALREYAANSDRLAIVLPSTCATTDSIYRRSTAMTVLGNASRLGSEGAIEVLKQVAGKTAPTTLVIHTDQLYTPTDATVLAMLPERSIFMSPVECILNDKYGYDLSVWTATGMRHVPAKTPFKMLIAHLTEHLKDCYVLGALWTEAQHQFQRTIEHRQKQGRRQLRYLTSSIAHAYADCPESPELNALLERLGGMEQSLQSKEVA